ncbi:hypothetical protein BGZ91_003392 [Linnemannia elongata]|nr:hypothetical protein BGZ91_003392 [Linnemannia elongata]
MTPGHKVFDIAELTTLIANNLTQHDLSLCCRVSKHLSTAFTPHLWHSITIQRTDPKPKFHSPASRAGLLRNGQYIRVLRSASIDLLEPFLEYGKTCTNLVALDTQYSYWSFDQVHRALPTPRSVAMMSKGRRGSLGCGQRPLRVDQGVGSMQGQWNEFGLGSSSSTSGLFGFSAFTPNSTGFSAPAATIGSGAPAPVTFGFGAGTTPAIGFGVSAADTPAATGFGAPVTGEFHGYGTTLSSLPAPTALATTSEPSSSSSSSSSIHTKPKADKSVAVAEETILLTLLAQNPHLEYLVLPSYCFEKEDIVALVGESLPSLQEFHSQSASWGQEGQWVARDDWNVARFSLFDRPVIHGMRSVPMFTGCIRPIAGAGAVGGEGGGGGGGSNLIATINRAVLDSLRAVTDTTLTYLEIEVNQVQCVEQICNQVLVNTPGEGSFLTSIEMASYRPGSKICFDNTVRDAFLRHAPTLEYIDMSGICFCSETLQALLDNGPRLKSVKTMEDSLGYQPSLETELDFLGAIQHLWRCEMLEVFECKIVNVPRPDVFVTEIGLYLDVPDQWTPPPPLETSPSPLAVQESHALQRILLKNLGRCTHLRKLWLGTFGTNRNDPEYSYLDLKGIRRMVVDSYMQTSCLELSLASGLDELSGLEELEELVVANMAHRMGLAEVKWMVEHWPRLRKISGLEYYDCNDDLLHDGEEDEERVVPECIVWLRENRPDITVS